MASLLRSVSFCLAALPGHMYTCTRAARKALSADKCSFSLKLADKWYIVAYRERLILKAQVLLQWLSSVKSRIHIKNWGFT